MDAIQVAALDAAKAVGLTAADPYPAVWLIFALVDVLHSVGHSYLDSATMLEEISRLVREVDARLAPEVLQ